MSQSSMRTLVRQLRHLAVKPDANLLTDSQLLARFVAERDETAFALLVQRHGPLVRGVCQRILPAQDAEDVFQATFLVLARKAGQVRWRASVAGWLYEVAYRLAGEARRRTARRQRHEREAATMRKREPATDAAQQDLCVALDEELHRLPAAERQPLLLCYLEGQTRDEAARQLGLSLRTLERRLQRGREKLRARLLRRGLTLSTALLVPEVLADGAKGVSVALAAEVARTAASFAAEETAAATSSPAVALARAFLKTMALAKAGPWVVLLALGAVVLAGAGFVLARTTAQPALAETAGPISSTATAPQRTQPPRLDRYGDPLPAGVIARMGTVRFRQASVAGLAFTSNGQHLVAAGGPAIRIWDTATAKEVRRFGIQQEPGRDWLLMVLRGTSLFTIGGADGLVHLWRLPDGTPIRQYGIVPEGAGCFAVSPDGRTLAIGSYELGKPMRFYLRLWDVPTGKILHTLGGYDSQIRALVFSPDGSALASVAAGTPKSVRLWSVATGVEKAHSTVDSTLKTRAGWSGLNRCPLLYTADGKTLIFGGTDHNIHLLNSESGKEIKRLAGHTADVSSLALLPQQRMLASASLNGTVRLWQLTTGKELGKLPRAGWRVAASEDGKQLATGGLVIRLWDTKSLKEIRPTGGHQHWIGAAALSPDGVIAVTAGEWTLRFWDATTGRERQLVQGRQDALAFAPNGKLLASRGQDGLIHLWNPLTGVEIRRFGSRAGKVTAVVFSPDGRLLASGGVHGTIRLWDPQTGHEVRHWPSGPKWIRSLSFSRDGRLLASTGYCASEVYLWDAASGRELHRLRCAGPDDGGAECVALSPDGRFLATAGLREPIRLWDTATGQLLTALRRDPNQNDALHFIRQVAFSADGRTLFSAENDGMVRVWEIPTGGLRRELAGHVGEVCAVRLSANNRRLLTAGFDTTALIWELQGRPAKSLEASWQALRGVDPAAAYQAVLDLSASGRPAITFLSKRLHPIRAAKPARVARLIADLDNPKFATRERAQAELASLAEGVEPAIRQALKKHPTPEQRRRLERLLTNLASVRLHNGRALEVLERMADPAARRWLQTLASGVPEASLTQEARASLARFQRSSPIH